MNVKKNKSKYKIKYTCEYEYKYKHKGLVLKYFNAVTRARMLVTCFY